MPATEITMTAENQIAYQIRCRITWMDRVRTAAKRLGLSPAAYIRQAVTKQLDADGAPEEESIKDPRGAKPKKKP